VDSTVVYDFVADVLRGAIPDARRRGRAFAIPVTTWHRVLGFDGCVVQFDRALSKAGLALEAPAELRRLLRDATNTAVQRALLVHAQLAELGACCAARGIRVMALKGAARLLAGELPGARSIADIDLLVAPRDASTLHALLQRELGYIADGKEYAHHLAGLVRPGSLGIEIHHRLTETPLQLDDMIWTDAQPAPGAVGVDLPSPTNLLLHTLEHAARVNSAARYRLRDVLDVATLDSPAFDGTRVARYVSASDCGRPMQILLAAAREANAPTAPRADDAWATVRRVGRTRIALAAWPRAPRIAERFFRYAGVVAEGSPRTIGRVGVDLARRIAGRAAAIPLALLALLAACERPTAPPPPLVVTPFVFASQSGGVWSLYRYADGSVTQLSTPGNNDREPHVVGHTMVFTSLRDGDAEIYSATLNADLTLAAQTRLTSEYGNDVQPALSPSGATIAFVSGRDGAPRVWLMDANGANPHALETGSATYIPEQSPRWSPDGATLAFSSTRTGTSQIFVVPAAGGPAVQISHETLGAYTPSWRPDGKSVLYMSLSGTPHIMSAPIGGGDPTVFATDTSGIGEPSCTAQLCLAVIDPLGSAGRIAALTTGGRLAAVAIPHVGDDHQPAAVAP
jgi:hypothetical protein